MKLPKFDKEGLYLCKNGKLINSKWIYDEKTNSGQYQSFDVTKKAEKFLFSPIQLTDNFSFKDFFSFCNKNNELFNLIIPYYSTEFIDEALNNKSLKQLDNKDKIDFLEVYFVWEVDDTAKRLIGSNRANFHAVGILQDEDYLDSNGLLMCKKNERINWSISFAKLNTLVDIPLKISDKLLICNSDGTYNTLLAPTISLADFVNSIIFEISFYGLPKNRDKCAIDIRKSSKKSKKKL